VNKEKARSNIFIDCAIIGILGIVNSRDVKISENNKTREDRKKQRM